MVLGFLNGRCYHIRLAVGRSWVVFLGHVCDKDRLQSIRKAAMVDQNVIDTIRIAAGWVHVDRPTAYEAFAQGKFIFDVSPYGELIDVFVAQLRSEFGVAIIRRKPFCLPNLQGVSVYIVHHERIPKSRPVKAASTIHAAPKLK